MLGPKPMQAKRPSRNASARYPGGGNSAANGPTSFTLTNSWPSAYHQNLKPWRVSRHIGAPGRPCTVSSYSRPASAPRETISSRQSPSEYGCAALTSHAFNSEFRC